MDNVEKSLVKIFEPLITEYHFVRKDKSFLKLSSDNKFLFLVQFSHLHNRRLFKIYFGVFPMSSGFVSQEVLNGEYTKELGPKKDNIYLCDWYYGANNTEIRINEAFNSVKLILLPFFESIQDNNSYIVNTFKLKQEFDELPCYDRIEIWPNLELQNYDEVISIIDNVSKIERDLSILKSIKIAIQKKDEGFLQKILMKNILKSKKALIELGLKM